jgi:hypothetical protein
MSKSRSCGGVGAVVLNERVGEGTCGPRNRPIAQTVAANVCAQGPLPPLFGEVGSQVLEHRRRMTQFAVGTKNPFAAIAGTAGTLSVPVPHERAGGPPGIPRGSPGPRQIERRSAVGPGGRLLRPARGVRLLPRPFPPRRLAPFARESPSRRRRGPQERTGPQQGAGSSIRPLRSEL